MFSRRVWVWVGVSFVLVAGIAAAAGAAYDSGRKDVIANGIRIGTVDVGGLDTQAAAERVHRLAVAPRRRDLTVEAAGREFVLPASRLQVTADVEGAVARAVADSRRGWIGRASRATSAAAASTSRSRS